MPALPRISVYRLECEMHCSQHRNACCEKRASARCKFNEVQRRRAPKLSVYRLFAECPGSDLVAKLAAAASCGTCKNRLRGVAYLWPLWRGVQGKMRCLAATANAVASDIRRFALVIVARSSGLRRLRRLRCAFALPLAMRRMTRPLIIKKLVPTNASGACGSTNAAQLERGLALRRLAGMVANSAHSSARDRTLACRPSPDDGSSTSNSAA